MFELTRKRVARRAVCWFVEEKVHKPFANLVAHSALLDRRKCDRRYTSHFAYVKTVVFSRISIRTIQNTRFYLPSPSARYS